MSAPDAEHRHAPTLWDKVRTVALTVVVGLLVFRAVEQWSHHVPGALISALLAVSVTLLGTYYWLASTRPGFPLTRSASTLSRVAWLVAAGAVVIGVLLFAGVL